MASEILRLRHLIASRSFLPSARLQSVVTPAVGFEPEPGDPLRCGSCGSSGGSRPEIVGGGLALRRRHQGDAAPVQDANLCGRRTG
jgi:hypothetical protein